MDWSTEGWPRIKKSYQTWHQLISQSKKWERSGYRESSWCMNAYTHTNKHPHVDICIYTYTHIYMLTHMHTTMHIDTHMQTNLHKHICYTYICINTYIHVSATIGLSWDTEAYVPEVQWWLQALTGSQETSVPSDSKGTVWNGKNWQVFGEIPPLTLKLNQLNLSNSS